MAHNGHIQKKYNLYTHRYTAMAVTTTTKTRTPTAMPITEPIFQTSVLVSFLDTSTCGILVVIITPEVDTAAETQHLSQ